MESRDDMSLESLLRDDDDVQMSLESTPAGYVVDLQSPLFNLLCGGGEIPTPNQYMVYNAQAVGIEPGQPWSAYPDISRDTQECNQSTLTTKAFIELYYIPETFGALFNMDKKFARLPIFRKEGSASVQLVSKASRSPYSVIHTAGMELLQENRKWMVRNIQTGNKNDIARLFNMAWASQTKLDRFVCEKSGELIQHTKVVGFFPYFSNRSDALGEIMFYFHHEALNRVVLITAPIDEREDAVNFIVAHGTIHTFDKLCAMCGKTGDLFKCPCKRVRYCGKPCQLRHWGVHKAGCCVKGVPGACPPC